MNQAAQALGKLAAGKKKTMSPAALAARKASAQKPRPNARGPRKQSTDKKGE